ncbi:MAG: hypothetical protein ACI93T_003215, partial [Porticoccaceae bacterium]
MMVSRFARGGMFIEGRGYQLRWLPMTQYRGGIAGWMQVGDA